MLASPRFSHGITISKPFDFEPIENLIANMEGIGKLIDFETDDVFLSFLPLSHVFERMGGHFTAFTMGASVYFAESIETVAENLGETSPSIVIIVSFIAFNIPVCIALL